MLGIIILLSSLVLYMNPHRRYISIFIYMGFMMGYSGGYGLLTDSVIGIKNMDCAIIYTFLINAYLVVSNRCRIPSVEFKPYYKILLLFLISSVIFSLFYYNLTPFQILQGGRRFLLLLSLPILIRTKPEELEKIIKLLFYICLLTSILYILQVLVVKKPLMPYGELGIDKTTGLPRFYNTPTNTVFFLSLSFLVPQWFPRCINLNIIRGILYVAILCSLGRTGIVMSTLTILFVLMLNGKFKKLVIVMIFLSLCLTPFIGTLNQRFEEGGTNDDMRMIMNGEFGRDYAAEGDATMLYRFAWCYERLDYLVQRPVAEQIFGMGLCSDSQDWVNSRYHFQIGLFNKEVNNISQLSTPDIAYGNMITYLGIGGMVCYLLFCISLTRFFWRRRKCSPMFLYLASHGIIMYISAFSGSALSETRTLSFMFLIMSLAYHPNGTGLMAYDSTKAKN